MLPDIDFASKDTRATEAGVVAGFEAAARLSGQSDFRLFPGDPRRLFLEAVALMIVHQNALIDKTGKANLLRYAGEDTIQDIGWLYGVRGDRLQPTAAVTTIEFTLSAKRSAITTIPQGTRLTPGNNIIFATTEPLDIPAHTLSGQVLARCNSLGAEGNGFLPGQINSLQDRNPFIASAENVTESSGGVGFEEIEAYRARVRLLPESFSVAGPDGAYEFWAKTASALITDVAVWMPPLNGEFFKRFIGEVTSETVTDQQAEYWQNRFNELCINTGTGPGNVNIAPLMEGGVLPTQDILDAVYEILNDKTRRPLTDFLHVQVPRTHDYNIDITYYIDSARASEVTFIQQAVTDAVDGYIAWQRGKLGRDINPSELTLRVMSAGAKRVVVREPVFTVIENDQVAQQVIVTKEYGGMESA